MGSTAVGRAVDTAVKDPGRGLLAIATLGQSEVLGAFDNKLFNDPRNKAEDMGAKAAAKMDAALSAQQAEVATQDLVKERNLQRARTRSMSANANGRSSTILTGPLGAANNPSLRSLLGS